MAIIPRSGKYGVRIHVRGQRVWIGTFDTEDEAKIAEIQAKRARVKRQETCREFTDRYLTDFNKTTRSGKDRWGLKTRQDMRYALRAFTKAFGSVRLRDLDVTDVRPWAASQPYKYVAVARTMMSDAVRDGLAERNPFSQLRLEHSRGRRDIDVITEDELEAAITKAEAIWGNYGSTAAAIIATAGYVACRPGELAALEPQDVDLHALELHIRQSFNGLELKAPKNGKPRRVILPPPAAERIARMPRALHSRWVFGSPQHRQLRRESIHRIWQPVRAAIGRPHDSFYALRHAGASFLLNRGASIQDVAHQLGHTDGGRLVAELYGHPDERLIRERLKRSYEANLVPLKGVEERAGNG